MEVRVYRHILNIGFGKYIRNLKIVTTFSWEGSSRNNWQRGCIVASIATNLYVSDIWNGSFHYFVTAELDHVLCRVKMVVFQMSVNMNLSTKLGSVYSYSLRDYRERCWDIVTQRKIW